MAYWKIWVYPNHSFVGQFPDGWSEHDVRRAADNQYGGKVQSVCAASPPVVDTPAPNPPGGINGDGTGPGTVKKTAQTSYTPETATGGSELFPWMLSIAWDVTWMTAKYAIKCCLEVVKLGLNYVVRPVLFGTSYVLRHTVHAIAVSSIWAINKCDEFTADTAQLIESGTANRWQF